MHCATMAELRAAADPLGRCLADPRIELDNSQFAQAVGNVAADLAADGIGHGDVVAVMLPNHAEMVVAMFRDHGRMDPASALYTIRISGHLGATVLSAFPALVPQRHGANTVLTGMLDRSALYGVLAEIEALGLDLIEVRQVQVPHDLAEGRT